MFLPKLLFKIPYTLQLSAATEAAYSISAHSYAWNLPPPFPPRVFLISVFSPPFSSHCAMMCSLTHHATFSSHEVLLSSLMTHQNVVEEHMPTQLSAVSLHTSTRYISYYKPCQIVSYRPSDDVIQ